MSHLPLKSSESEALKQAVEKPPLSPFVTRARSVFKAMVMIFGICILIQVFLAGLALFWDSAQWAGHTGFSRVLIVVSILVLALSFIARMPRTFRLRSAGLFGILLLIAISAALPSEIGYLSALHPVLALLLFFGSVSLLKKTGALQNENRQRSGDA